MNFRPVFFAALCATLLSACTVKEQTIGLNPTLINPQWESTRPSADTYESALTGMLLVLDPAKCPIAAGCGPQFSLLGQNLTTQVAVNGDIDPAHAGLILSVEGNTSTLPSGLSDQSGYERINTVADVKQYRVLSSIPYHAYLAEAATEYTTENFGCVLLWDKLYSWDFTRGGTQLIVRMTDTYASGFEPWIELSYDGLTGELIQAAAHPVVENPCDL